MIENANDPTLPTSASKPFSVVLVIDYRNQSETRTVALPAILGRCQEADVRLHDPWISHIRWWRSSPLYSTTRVRPSVSRANG